MAHLAPTGDHYRIVFRTGTLMQPTRPNCRQILDNWDNTRYSPLPVGMEEGRHVSGSNTVRIYRIAYAIYFHPIRRDFE